MKMVKSLLLGSAAGLVAVTAGQAADLPVKAKPVEYVKVCNLYGAGFYYIPGTDTCIKIGGFIRTEWNIHAGGSFGAFTAGGNAFQYRAEDNFVTRARMSLTADVREQTAYGTLRGYLAAGWQYSTDDAPTVSLPGAVVGSTGGAASPSNSNNSNIYVLRGFIQWGGFTFGKTASFFDFINTSKYTLQTNFLWQDFGGTGIFTYGYTQQLGNGIAATIAVQDVSPFQKNIVDVTGGGGTVFTTAPTNNNFQNAGTLVPDIVGSIRVDQAWGGAQIAAALHDVRARYYDETSLGNISGVAHPGDKWGWAIQGGIEVNLPWAKGDSAVVQSQYCVGAAFYCSNFGGGGRYADLAYSLVNVNKVGLGWIDDAYVGNEGDTANNLQLSTTWNIVGAIQHYWVPEVRTSLYGGYLEYKANSSTLDHEICQENSGGANVVGGHVSPTGCADWAAWMIGSRTLWNPTKNLDIGVDVLYTQMAKTAFSGAVVNFAPGGNAAANTFTVGDTHIWAGILRVQYNFYP